ncbi:trafficking protein particle complex subunit 10 isoform X2 [Brienomyrus brachyistius]|uniref:trafficking protein particle complex subunit 10 isoform X2 n=1 Tax=Brienomyrus brachyistius TaxID=42636 RepID=UPI0020B1AD98|nr:trafficking protein particle complex subunit 10 isoform X2 [Brienomyrus brachyistius]
MESHEEKPIIYTMENKPIVTCAGDQTLFSSLYNSLTQQLPREPMEWRRSYGRAPKMIHLEANFVQFKEDLLPKEGNKALLTFPFLHIFWTDCCDTEAYKASVKEDIVRWQSLLRLHSTLDWLIVVVESDAKKKNKTNILPRTSIVDKIRNDFCNKQSDRCVVLSDPLKDSSRSQESWSSFLTKLRTLLLMSFTRNLGRFEDDMRTLREKRTEPGWSFCDYFMVQEELAFVFEMLQQFEDALVQYDELDALFTQYVLNFGAGDGANWLGSFCQPLRSWNGLLLRRPIDMEKREQIQHSQASLLDLRSYLFSRQCTLLLFLLRPWEVTRRALELLHTCVQELRLLEVSVPQGALDCWVFLSCLEVLQRIEGCCDRAQLEANSSHTVGLWTYATEKLKSLGYLCGLVAKNGPNSEDLNKTVDLLGGLGAERPETASSLQSPYKKLKEALSSVESFEKHYLELSHTAMDMYRTIGRTRSARLMGKSLAEFYMRKGDPKRAESFLQDSVKSYLSEGWALPVAHTRKQMAECQKLLGQTEDYLQTSALLASDSHLTDSERKHFCQEILSFAGQSAGHKVILNMSSFAQLRQLQFRPAAAVVHVGASLQLELRLRSLMPVPVRLEQLAITVHFSLEKGGTWGRAGPGGGAPRRTGQGSPGGAVQFPGESPPGSHPRTPPPTLELYEMQDRSPSDGVLNSTGVVCKNVHLLLRRQDSAVSLDTPSVNTIAMEDGAQLLKTHDVSLLPGNNDILFTAPSQEPGTYTLRQLCATVGQVQFVLPHIYPIVQYEVYSQEPQLTVEPLADNLVAGLPQTVKFTVVTGHYSIKRGDALQLSNSDSMPILPAPRCTARVLSSTAGESRPARGGLPLLSATVHNLHDLPCLPFPSTELVTETVLSIQSSEKVTSISLPLAPPYHTVEFQLVVLCHVPAGPVRPDPERLTNGEPWHRPRSRLRTHSGMITLDQKISIDCPWSIYSTLVALTFYIPFKAKHSLLSAGKRKYVQVCLQNVSDMNFQLAEQSLILQQRLTTLGLRSLNGQTKQRVYSKQSVFYLWEMTWSIEPPPSLQCLFSISFCPADSQSSHFTPYHYEFQLDSLSTLYSVSADIQPASGESHCKTGSLCGLEVSITRLSEVSEAEKQDEGSVECGSSGTTKLMYEVVDNSSNWAVCGKSSGIVFMPIAAQATHKVRMEVMPLFAGNLPFPSIKVSKYLPHQALPAIQPDTDGCLENDNISLLDKGLTDDQADTSSIRSRGSVVSLGSGEQQRGLPMPRLEPFGPGQVFNRSQGCQVLVLPSKDDHVLEVNVT